MESIILTSLKEVESCIDEKNPGTCATRLLASVDAIYTPLKPINSGLGEVRRISSLLAGILANTFIELARKKFGDEAEEFLRATMEELGKTIEDTVDYVRSILEKANIQFFEPAMSREARESLYNDIKEYVEPPKPSISRRRRLPPRRPDPRQRLFRLLKELGRRDPFISKFIDMELRKIGVL